MKKNIGLFVLLLGLVLFTACANKEIVSECLTGTTYGFLGGLWHGIIAPFDLIAMLFRDDVTVYAQNNNGAWYAFGFILGSGGWGILGSKGAKRKKEKNITRNIIKFMIMKRIIFIILLLTMIVPVKAQFLKKLKKAAEDAVEETSKSGNFTEEEAARALKEALTIGIEKGVDKLSKPDGYYKDLEIKIPIPKEAQQVEEKLRMLGMDKAVDDAIESMNRAAEDAATGAKDIFITAIKELTLKDVMSIINGENDAATQYLENHTRTQLIEKFKPIIKVSLDKVNATKYWKDVFSYYNKLPFVKKVNPDLNDYVTNKAIDGLFVQIAKEEQKIRKDPLARVTDLLKKVFG